MVIYNKYTTDSGTERVKAYSDKSVMIERDGALYSEADDFAYQQRVYNETDIPIDPQPETDLTVNDTLEILNNTNNNQVNNEDIFNSLLWNGNNIEYKTNDKVIYNNSIYNVIKNHTSKPDWKPDSTIGLFELIK